MVACVCFLFEFAIMKNCAPKRAYYTAVNASTMAYRPPPTLKLGVTIVRKSELPYLFFILYSLFSFRSSGFATSSFFHGVGGVRSTKRRS